ncbi:hypothetical protein THAOC_06150, partial [Thalassiosira oceanica]
RFPSLSTRTAGSRGTRSAVTPGGVRIGAPALTTRKFLEADFEQIAVFLHEALQIALKIQEKSGPKLVDFVKCLGGNEDIAELKKRVNEFAVKFPMPGFDPAEMKYKLMCLRLSEEQLGYFSVITSNCWAPGCAWAAAPGLWPTTSNVWVLPSRLDLCWQRGGHPMPSPTKGTDLNRITTNAPMQSRGLRSGSNESSDPHAQ